MLKASTRVRVLADGMADAVQALDEALTPVFGQALAVETAAEARPGTVNVACDPAMPAEAYRLAVTPERIDITAEASMGRSMPYRRFAS